MQHKQTIIYTGNFNIEHMNAAGKRVFANALVMQSLGYHMVMVGVDGADQDSMDVLSTYSEAEGIEIYHYPESLYQHHRLNYGAFYQQLIRLMDCKNWEVKAIIGYNSPSLSLFIGKVQRYCRKRGIKYITDVADWLIVDSDRTVFRVFRQFDITLKNAYYSNKSNGVIAISTWLADYYKRKVENVIIVPPLSYRRSLETKKNNEIPQIVYAGIPFSKGAIMSRPEAMKDRFDIVCKALSGVLSQGVLFSFDVYGFSKEEFLYSLPYLSDEIAHLGESIKFHGYASMETIQEAVSGADYTILIRERNRMTMAGFPTKVSESIACGTPVITTRTSDIDKYIQEGAGAFFVDSSDMEELQDKLCELLKKNKDDRINQKKRCSEVTAFDGNTYSKLLAEFLEKVLR